MVVKNFKSRLNKRRGPPKVGWRLNARPYWRTQMLFLMKIWKRTGGIWKIKFFWWFILV